MEPLFIADNFDSHKLSQFMVNASQNLPKTSLSKNVNNFIAVRKVVTSDNRVVAPLIVVAKIWCVRLQITDDFACALGAAKVNIMIVDNFASFVNIEHGNADGFLRTHALLGRSPFLEGIQSSCRNVRFLASRTHLAHLVIGCQIILVELIRAIAALS